MLLFVLLSADSGSWEPALQNDAAGGGNRRGLPNLVSVTPSTRAEQRRRLATTLPPTKSGADVNATKLVGVGSLTATCHLFRTGERAPGGAQGTTAWDLDLGATTEYCPLCLSCLSALEKSKPAWLVGQPACFVHLMMKASPFEKAVDFVRDLPEGEDAVCAEDLDPSQSPFSTALCWITALVGTFLLVALIRRNGLHCGGAPYGQSLHLHVHLTASDACGKFPTQGEGRRHFCRRLLRPFGIDASASKRDQLQNAPLQGTLSAICMSALPARTLPAPPWFNAESGEGETHHLPHIHLTHEGTVCNCQTQEGTAPTGQTHEGTATHTLQTHNGNRGTTDQTHAGTVSYILQTPDGNRGTRGQTHEGMASPTLQTHDGNRGTTYQQKYRTLEGEGKLQIHQNMQQCNSQKGNTRPIHVSRHNAVCVHTGNLAMFSGEQPITTRLEGCPNGPCYNKVKAPSSDRSHMYLPAHITRGRQYRETSPGSYPHPSCRGGTPPRATRPRPSPQSRTGGPYHERQINIYCQFYSINTFIGGPVLSGPRILAFAENLHTQLVTATRNPAGIRDRHYNKNNPGNFSVPLTNKFISQHHCGQAHGYLTAQAIPPYIAAHGPPPHQLRETYPRGIQLGSSREQICTALADKGWSRILLHYTTPMGYGHAVCLKQHHGEWFLINAEEPHPINLSKTPPTLGWHTVSGHIYTLEPCNAAHIMERAQFEPDHPTYLGH